MTGYQARRLAGFAIFALLLAAVAWAVWSTAYGQALAQLSQRARVDLALASDRLTGQLQRYRELAVLLADHPQVTDLALGQGDAAAADALLLRTVDRTATLDIFLVDRSGARLASASGGAPETVALAPYFNRAMDGALGFYHGLSDRFGARAFYYAAPVFGPRGAVRAALVVMLDVEDMEAVSRGSRPAVFFTDDLGAVFLSNRSELVFMQRGQGRASESAAYPGGVLRPFARFESRMERGHEVWRIEAGPYIPARALHLTQNLPVIGMTGEALIDVAPARNIAALQMAVAVAVCLVFGALLFLATERRRTLALANMALEARVEERTEALRQAQAELVQAGKLRALGQMSAGISHELNQPLMAIQSFADNAAQFITRGKPDIAAQNLGRIADLARKMGRIIKNFRAFAKQEDEPLRRVDVAHVIESALEITHERLERAGVRADWTPPDAPVWVRAGEVRLSQVIVNLISNAADAMAGSAERVIVLGVTEGVTVEVTVRDTGPGIEEPDKIFDPFYSTKEVGASEGMGLGLSISYGLVQSFGGAIRGANTGGPGAVFTIELPRWQQSEAA